VPFAGILEKERGFENKKAAWIGKSGRYFVFLLPQADFSSTDSEQN
jgi:hypothetical protein